MIYHHLLSWVLFISFYTNFEILFWKQKRGIASKKNELFLCSKDKIPSHQIPQPYHKSYYNDSIWDQLSQFN